MNSILFLMKLSNKLILASGSPRRKELLEKLGVEFEVKTIQVEETFSHELRVTEVAEFLAVKKNRANRRARQDEVIITADTVVIHDNQILGKPDNEQDAISTLQKISGKTHKVVTGVCISSPDLEQSFSVTTEVKFRELLAEEIEYYVSAFKPMDKAGSYAIQEWIGLIGVEWIKGSFYNVVGLPVFEVYQTLKRYAS